MKKILVIGAGRSSISLIDYLLTHSATYDWQVTVADMDINLALDKTAKRPGGKAIAFDIKDESARQSLIREHDLVISMLPAMLHGDVARDCVHQGKHMATASYVSPDMKNLDAEAKRKGILLLNECGLDPGIDHASAMKIIDKIRQEGGRISSFKSYCGGLVAPESNDNPWGYKFSWNPRNVVLAGQGTAQYLHNKEVSYIPYNRLFEQTEVIEVEGYGKFDAYANRDSIAYKDIYGLGNIASMLRGTLRQQGYCKAWNILVKLGLTDDSTQLTNPGNMTYSSLLASFLPPGAGTLKNRVRDFSGSSWDEDTDRMLTYLDLFSDKPIPLAQGTPAQLLQALLEEKWRLKEGDKDMIVMQHQFEYFPHDGADQLQKLTSSLVVKGRDSQHTAMALTVGLPLAITVKNFLCKKFELYGVQIPIDKAIYGSLLSELEEKGITFTECS